MRLKLTEDRTVLFTDAVLRRLKLFAQVDPRQLASGGYLLGRLMNGNRLLRIEMITEPQRGDKRSRFSFGMNSPRHGKAIKRVRAQTRGQVNYWGNWHTHAQAIPVPSETDIATWKECVTSLNWSGDATLFFVIVGMIETRVWAVDQCHSVMALVPEVSSPRIIPPG